MHHEFDMIHEQFNHVEIRGQIMTWHMDEECRDQEAIEAQLTSLHYVGLTIYNADIRDQYGH